MQKLFFLLCFLIGGWTSNVLAENQTVDLVVSEKWVNFTGKPQTALTINQQLPGPTLHFKQGDHVTINVYNHLTEGTSIHWHGVIVPWQMDGVVGVSQKPIPPGGVFHYQFTLHQAGTYWYHAHADAQEQDGIYGAFIIDPPQKSNYPYNRDYVVVLSDWSDLKGEKIFANLKKDGDYFSPRFPLQPSLMKFLHDYSHADAAERKQLLQDYKTMQWMRMSIYDLSDVAYDAYLLNGQTQHHPWIGQVKPGDVVRLRFIGAPASTIYRVKIPGTKMRMVHVQGNDVAPYDLNDFYIAPGETYDVLVKIEKNIPYIIYAESIDTLGKAYGILGNNTRQKMDLAVTPFPEPIPVTREMMQNMSAGMNHSMNMPKDSHMDPKMDQTSMEMTPSNTGTTHTTMNHSSMHSMNMPTEPTIVGDKITIPNKNRLAIKTTGTKYQDLKAATPTNDPHKPVDGIIRMELFGYMGRYIWFINGLPEYKAKPILIEPNKRYRLIFTNNSMMRHPMHIHLHWFILRNGHGVYDPLLHTIEVPPGATAVADIDADASGQAFFHCHHLFHMMAGMARVFQYGTLIEIAKGSSPPENETLDTQFVNRPIIRKDEVLPIDPTLVKHPMGHHQGFYWANFLDIGEDPFHNIQAMTFKGLYGSDYNKLELFMNDAEIDQGQIDSADMDIFYWRLINQFWAIKGGVNYFNQPAEKPYWQPGIGIEGLMPYFIELDERTYFHNDSFKFDIELNRDTQITNNFFIKLGIRSILATQTVTSAEIGSGLNQMQYTIHPYYRLFPGLFVFTEYEHQQDYGDFKNIRHNSRESTNEDRITFGLSLIF